MAVTSRRNTALSFLWPPSATTHVLAHTRHPGFVWPESKASEDDAVADDLEGAASEKSAVFHRNDAPVIVPLDGSALAEQALPYACAWARAFERPLTLLRVILHVTLLGGGAYTYQWSCEVERLDAQEARDYLTAVRNRLRADPENAEIHDIEILVKIGVATATILNTTAIYPLGAGGVHQRRDCPSPTP
ncbi:MAG: universal stress protein [Ktedonobacterales bacterium]